MTRVNPSRHSTLATSVSAIAEDVQNHESLEKLDDPKTRFQGKAVTQILQEKLHGVEKLEFLEQKTEDLE